MKRARRRRQVHLIHRGRWNRAARKRGIPRITVDYLYAQLHRHMRYWFHKKPELAIFEHFMEHAQ